MHLVTITARPRVLAGLTALALLIAACGSGGEATAPRQPVAAVRIVPESVEVVVRGTVQLTAATLVTALKRGSTTVTFTCQDRRATAVVIVFLPMGV